VCHSISSYNFIHFGFFCNILRLLYTIILSHGCIISVCGIIFSNQNVGPQTWIILNDYDVVVEAMVTRKADFAGRPKFASGKIKKYVTSQLK
jgi:hypothetical protein